MNTRRRYDSLRKEKSQKPLWVSLCLSSGSRSHNVTCVGCSVSCTTDHAELLQHAQRVEVQPAFHELAVHDAVNTHSRDRHRLACRWNAHELALMRATQRRAAGNPVPFGKFEI